MHPRINLPFIAFRFPTLRGWVHAANARRGPDAAAGEVSRSEQRLHASGI
jgi:hypothetical protein